MSNTGATPPPPSAPVPNSSKTGGEQGVLRPSPSDHGHSPEHSTPKKASQNISDRQPRRIIRQARVERAPPRLTPDPAKRTTIRTEARVTEQKPDGTTRLQTSDGEEIILRTQARLAEGQRVILQLRAARDQQRIEQQITPRQDQPPRQRLVAEADITVLRSSTGSSATKTAQNPPTAPDASQSLSSPRIAVQPDAVIKARFIPTTTPSPAQSPAPSQTPSQTAPQPALNSSTSATDATVMGRPQPLSALTAQQVLHILARSELPILISTQPSNGQYLSQTAPPALSSSKTSPPPSPSNQSQPTGHIQIAAQSPGLKQVTQGTIEIRAILSSNHQQNLSSRASLARQMVVNIFSRPGILPSFPLPLEGQPPISSQAFSSPTIRVNPQSLFQLPSALLSTHQPHMQPNAAPAPQDTIEQSTLTITTSTGTSEKSQGLLVRLAQQISRASGTTSTQPAGLFLQKNASQSGSVATQQAAIRKTQALQSLLQELGITQPTGSGGKQASRPLSSPSSAPSASAMSKLFSAEQNPTLRIINIIRPGQIPANIKALHAMLPSSPQSITGVVTGLDKTGNPIVATARGQFILTHAKSIETSSVLSFRITSGSMAKLPEPTIWPLPPLDPIRGERWTAMEDALSVLQHENPSTAQALRNLLPGPVATRFTTSVLFFLAAIRAGDLNGWMGERQIQALRDAGRSDLLTKLRSDFGRITTQATETMPGDWRAIPVPFMHEGQVMKIQLFMRQQRDKGDKNSQKKQARQTRFLIEARLRHIGDMQIDGLFMPLDKRLDLVLRAKETLPRHLCNGAAGRYREALSATGLTGELHFQSHGKGWVHLGRDDGHNGHIGMDA